MTKEELGEKFWTNLKAELKRQHKTYKELSEETGINQHTISSMVFRRTLPDIWFLAATCRVLEVEPSVLLYGPEKETDSSSLTDKEKAVIRILRSGTKEENEQELSLFISSVRSIRRRKPCWYWDSIAGKFSHRDIENTDFDCVFGAADGVESEDSDSGMAEQR